MITPSTFLRHAGFAWRRWWHRGRGVRLASSVLLEPRVALIPGWRENHGGTIEIGERTRLERGAICNAWGASIRIGHECFVGAYSVIFGQGTIEIGDGTLIAMHCRILSSNHGVPAPDRFIRHQPDVLAPTRIGRDVWLGAGVTVLAGVTIGDGCVVGAGAVVTRDLPPYSIAHGVPAAVVSRRDERRNPSR